MSNSKGAVAVIYGWEGNHRSGLAPGMHHRVCDIFIYRLDGLRKADNLHFSKEYGTIYLYLFGFLQAEWRSSHSTNSVKALKESKLKALMSTATRAQHLLRWATVSEQSGPKSGRTAVPLSVGELGLHLTQCRLGRSLLPYQVASRSIQPFRHNRHGSKSGRVLCPFRGRAESSSNTSPWPRSSGVSQGAEGGSCPRAQQARGRKNSLTKNIL